MNRLTPEQRFQIVEIYFVKNKSVREVHRALRPFYGQHNRPSEQAIRAVIDRSRTNFTLLDSKPSTRQINVRTEENIAAVTGSIEEDAEMPIRRRSQFVGLYPSTTWKILRKDLGLRAYKIQLVQELKPNDHRLRRIFADWAHLKLAEDEHFYQRIVFSDEAHFWLNGYVNKQNCRIWSEDNPQAVNESPLHPLKLTVWCGLHAGGIIDHYFFRNEQGAAVTVNGERYRAMLTEFLFPKINQLNINDIWFQQDGATCHTARLTIDLLQNQFGDNFISRSGPVHWPPRSCDLTPLDYFLWGYVKSLVYADKPATLEALEANIQATIDAIRPDLLEKVVKNWTDRMDHVTRSRGGHMPEIIFKK